jgi:tRNA(Arg) A34 adenosine deaminase TadA
MNLYTKAEPCSMCSTVIPWAGIPRVVYGTSVETPNGLGFPKLDVSTREIAHRTSLGDPVVVRVLEDACADLLEALVRRIGRS